MSNPSLLKMSTQLKTPFKNHLKNLEKTCLFKMDLTSLLKLMSLIINSWWAFTLQVELNSLLKMPFKNHHLFLLTSLLKMDLMFIIKISEKLTSLLKMDLTSLLKTSFKNHPSGSTRRNHNDHRRKKCVRQADGPQNQGPPKMRPIRFFWWIGYQDYDVIFFLQQG